MSFDASFFEKNREKFFEKMKNSSLALFFQANEVKKGDEVYLELVDPNFFYLCGIEEMHTRLLLIKDEKGKCESLLFLKKGDERMRLFHGESLSQEEASKASGIKEVLSLEDFEKKLEEELKAVDSVYFFEDEEYDSQLNSYKNCVKKIKAEQDKEFLNAEALLRKVRLIKSEEEITAMKNALEITHKAFLEVFRKTKEAEKESDLKAVLDYEIAKAQTKHAYTPIIATGKNACILHYPYAKDRIEENELILIDFGAEYEHYASDITRTIPKSAKFSERQKAVYEACLRIQEEAFKTIQIGKTLREYEKELRLGIIFNELLTLKLIKEELKEGDEKEKMRAVSKYYPHLTSHFLGLDVHDLGSKHIDTLIEEGQVLTVEPGIYIPEESLGIRIEDNVLVKEKGLEILSKEIPKTVQEIEKLINGNQ